MTPLTQSELLTIDGGWDWGDFFGGFVEGATAVGAVTSNSAYAVINLIAGYIDF